MHNKVPVKGCFHSHILRFRNATKELFTKVVKIISYTDCLVPLFLSLKAEQYKLLSFKVSHYIRTHTWRSHIPHVLYIHIIIHVFFTSMHRLIHVL